MSSFFKFLGPLLDEHLSWKYHLNELSKKLSRTCGIFFNMINLLPLDVLLCLFLIKLFLLSFLQYGLLFGAKHLHHILSEFSNCKKMQSERFHFSEACLPHFKFLKISNFLNFLIFFNSISCLLYMILSIKLHPLAFMTFSY